MTNAGTKTRPTSVRMHSRQEGQDTEGAQIVWIHQHREPKDSREGANSPASERREPSMWRLGLLCALGLLTFALAGALAFWTLDAKDAWLALPLAISRVKPVLVAVHFALIGLAWWRWGRIVQWMFRRGWVHADNVKAALSMRHRVAAFFVIFEFLVVIRWPLGAW